MTNSMTRSILGRMFLLSVVVAAPLAMGGQESAPVVPTQVAPVAQAPAADGAAVEREPDAAATLAWIHKSWDVLSRSMTDCHSLVDVKVTTNPVLYVRGEKRPCALCL